MGSLPPPLSLHLGMTSPAQVGSGYWNDGKKGVVRLFAMGWDADDKAKEEERGRRKDLDFVCTIETSGMSLARNDPGQRAQRQSFPTLEYST